MGAPYIYDISQLRVKYIYNLELFYKKTNESSPVTSTMRVKGNSRCIPSLVYDESTCNHEDDIKSIIILTK